jgi:hypothetical protein
MFTFLVGYDMLSVKQWLLSQSSFRELEREYGDVAQISGADQPTTDNVRSIIQETRADDIEMAYANYPDSPDTLGFTVPVIAGCRWLFFPIS